MEDIQYRILGPVEVIRGGGVLPIGAPRQRAVLACLLLEANRVVSLDRLTYQLWGEKPPPRARNTIHSLVLRLRQTLSAVSGCPLTTRPPGYLLRIDAADLDLTVFESLVAQGRREMGGRDVAAGAATLRSALALWRGEPLAGAAGSRLQEVDAPHLHEMRFQVLEDRMEADLALGRSSELVGELRMAIADCPNRERLHAMLMVALYREGRQREAFDVFYLLRRRLIDELGVEPTALIQDLYGQMLAHVPPLALVVPGRHAWSMDAVRPQD